tara:strand:+ start:8186 stop:8506 length:321 start_codon:yes stop_codon:yes gene_type:complete
LGHEQGFLLISKERVAVTTDEEIVMELRHLRDTEPAQLVDAEERILEGYLRFESEDLRSNGDGLTLKILASQSDFEEWKPRLGCSVPVPFWVATESFYFAPHILPG